MKLFLGVVVALFGCTPAPYYNCYAKKPTGTVEEQCDQTPYSDKCKGPSFDADTGYSDMEQQCGECTQEEITVKGCVDCEKSDYCNIIEVVDMKCNEYEWKTDRWGKKVEDLNGAETEVMEACETKKFLDDHDTCRRPIGDENDVLDSFCGACTSVTANTVNTVCTNSPIACFTVAEGETEAKSTTCNIGVTDCKGPSFVDAATGYSDMEQDCGKCTTEEIAVKGCEGCDTDDCNMVKEREEVKCNEYEWKTDKWVKKMEGEVGSETEVMEACGMKFTYDPSVCRRPIGDGNDVLGSFCGACTSVTANTVCTNSPIACFTVAEGETEAKSTTCNIGATDCKGPSFIAATGYSDMKQECGTCTTEEIAVKGCEDCDTDDCNMMKELEDVKCNEYEWKTDKWVKKMEGEAGSEIEVMENCKKFQGEDETCRTPTGTAAEDDLVSYCGACAEDTECSNDS